MDPTTVYKRIIICCDGTWQASDRSDKENQTFDSNVTRLSRALAKTVVVDGQTVHQIVYYISGIGTSGLTNLSHYIAGMSLCPRADLCGCVYVN